MVLAIEAIRVGMKDARSDFMVGKSWNLAIELSHLTPSDIHALGLSYRGHCNRGTRDRHRARRQDSSDLLRGVIKYHIVMLEDFATGAV